MAAPLNASTTIPLASHVHTLAVAVSTAATSSVASRADPPLLAAPSLVSPVNFPGAMAPRGSTKSIPKSKKSKLLSSGVPAVANQTAKTSSKPAISDLESDSDNDIPLSLLMECPPEGRKRARAVSPVKQERPRATRRLVMYCLQITGFGCLLWSTQKAAAKLDEMSSQASPPSVQTSMSVQRKVRKDTRRIFY